ncbi:MAG: hypothetical protein A4E19_11905 [Nitrospira sp. SG-bin1]|nr:MAG: hypothetical protein A4E19_11905 [Nitrospira sp. SG-bin1]
MGCDWFSDGVRLSRFLPLCLNILMLVRSFFFFLAQLALVWPLGSSLDSTGLNGKRETLGWE